MYEDYYGLEEQPFQLTPDPKYFFYSASHKEAYAQLLLGIELRRGFIVLTGEVGTGKTTILRAIMHEINDNTRTALIFHTLLSAKGLLQNICKEFSINTDGCVSKTDYVMRLHDFLQEVNDQGGNAVLIIDEAHNLKGEILEELRLLSNFETENTKLLQICLVGQPELLATLSRQDLRQLNQRISLKFHLGNLSLEETAEYIRHRLSVAGSKIVGELFAADAIAAIHRLSDGTPREINKLCENALVMGYVKNVKQIDAALIESVTAEDTFQEFDGVFQKTETFMTSRSKSGPAPTPAAGRNAGPPSRTEPSRRHSGRPAGVPPGNHASSVETATVPPARSRERAVSDFNAVAPQRQAEDTTLWQPADAGPEIGSNGQSPERQQTAGPEPAPQRPARADIDAGELAHAIERQVLRRITLYLNKYILIEKPARSSWFAWGLVGVLVYVLAVLLAVLFIQKLHLL